MSESLPVLASKSVRIGFVLVVFLLTFGVYAASLRNDFVRWDDGLLIYENPAVREVSLRSLKTIFTTYDPELYIPLTLLSYKLDYLIGGTHPFVYHLSNLLLHTLNVLLVAWFTFLLSRNRWVACFVALVFAIHPFHTEAVAWASARKDLLSTFFFLGSLIAYLYYQRNAVQTGRSVLRPYMASLALFILGLLSKVMVLTLPLILFLMDWREGRRWGKKMLLEKVPYLLLSVLFGVIALFGKRAVTAEATIVQTVLMAAKSTMFYLQKLFVPTGLSVLYPYTESIRLSSPDFFLPLLVLLVLFVLLILSLRFTRELLFGFLFFFITLAATFVNFSKDGEFYFASDRYAYIPSIGILYLVCWLLLAVRWRKFSIFNFQFSICISILLVIALVFSGLTYRQSLIWNNTETLFRNVLAHYPNSHRARNNLANALRRQGLFPEAILEFKAALAIREHPKTLSNLGAVYRKLGKMEEALVLYEKALAIAPEDPEPHFGLGIVYAQEGAFDQALASYERSLALDPDYVDVWNNLGALYAQRGDFGRAVESYEKAIAINPLYYQAHYNLAVASESIGQFDEALQGYREAVRLEPGFTPARINIGLLLFRGGRVTEARKHFEEVLKVDPGNRRARSALEQLDERTDAVLQ